jgi:SAM-dependent methyltransferase
MASYSGKYADYYDTFYGNKDYVGESQFVFDVISRLANAAPRRVLELACGTGSHAFCLERLGLEIVATDLSEDMLRVARGKAARLSSRVDFRRRDMRAIDPDQFDAAISLFDSIGHVLDSESIASVLRGIRSVLRPGGVFLCEFLHSAAMLRSFEPVRVRRWLTSTGNVVRIAETSLDVCAQLVNIEYEVIDLRRDGHFIQVHESQINRFFSVPEMHTLLTAAGLIPRRFFAGFSDNERIDATVWRVVAVAERR